MEILLVCITTHGLGSRIMLAHRETTIGCLRAMSAREAGLPLRDTVLHVRLQNDEVVVIPMGDDRNVLVANIFDSATVYCTDERQGGDLGCDPMTAREHIITLRMYGEEHRLGHRDVEIIVDTFDRISDLRQRVVAFTGKDKEAAVMYTTMPYTPCITAGMDHHHIREVLKNGCTVHVKEAWSVETEARLSTPATTSPRMDTGFAVQEDMQHPRGYRGLLAPRTSPHMDTGFAVREDMQHARGYRGLLAPRIAHALATDRSQPGQSGTGHSISRFPKRMRDGKHSARLCKRAKADYKADYCSNVSYLSPKLRKIIVETVDSDTDTEDMAVSWPANDSVAVETSESMLRRSTRARRIRVAQDNSLPTRRARIPAMRLSSTGALVCCNCRRTQAPAGSDTGGFTCVVEMGQTMLLAASFRRRRFCFVPPRRNNPPRLPMCGECYHYLSQDYTKGKKDVASLWPAFVWSVLAMETVPIRHSWKLVPMQWRPFWLDSVSAQRGVTQAELEGLGGTFRDLTLGTRADLAALESLRWAEDIKPREHSLSMAEVKCPAGCSEWKHKSNGLPMDIVWEYCLGVELRIYSSPSARECSVWFRKDYLQNEVILGNEAWVCGPAICRSTVNLAPEVMCCRHHSVRNKKHIVHPCRSPTGFVATEKASQFTPVTAVPRTLRKARAYGYSAAFQVAKMEGSYYGLDTMFLSEESGWPYHQSKLAWTQEVLAAAGRRDLYSHISRLSESNKIAPNLAESMLTGRDTMFPNWPAVRDRFEKGSTYVGLQDATLLQQELFYGGRETIRLRRKDLPDKEASIRGPWPQNLIRVHPGGCAAGQRFRPLMKFSQTKGNDARAGWILASMVACVPELWNAVAKENKSSDEWEGWLLANVTSKCFTHLRSRGGGGNPYRGNITQWQLFKDYIQLGQETAGYVPRYVKEKFDSVLDHTETWKYPTVLSLWDEFQVPTDAKVDIVVVVKKKRGVYQRDEGVMTSPWTPTETADVAWDLRYVALSEKVGLAKSGKWMGSIYARHGGESHPTWWRAARNTTYVGAKAGNWTIADIKEEHIHKWNACVYVRKQQLDVEATRDQVLTACGGQSSAYCLHHKYPLTACVQTEQTRQYICGGCDSVDTRGGTEAIRCTRSAIYACPYTACTACICKVHLQGIQSTGGKHYMQPIAIALPSESGGNSPGGHHRCGSDGIPNPNLVDTAEPEARFDEARTRFFASQEASEMDSIQEGLASDLRDEAAQANRRRDTLMGEAFVLSPKGGQDDLDGTSRASYNGGPQPSPTIPSTDAGAEPLYADMQDSAYSAHVMSNHALLNCYGSCLIRRNRKMTGTIRQQAFLQRQVARNSGESVPLVYPEAMLFSDLFFADADRGSAVLGAIPASLLHGDTVVRDNGFESLSSTMRTRMMSPGILTSSNPKYHFWAFDALANIGMRGHDSRMILRRGFAEAQGTGGVRIKGSTEPIFDSESVECRSVVNKLAACIAEDHPAYFYTHTCSMKTHFGMRILWGWLTGPQIEEDLCPEDTDAEIDAWKKSVIDSSGAYLLRCWMELMHIWILYITKSPDKPMGTVTKHWCRMELQSAGAKGNLPHMHCLFWTDDDLSTPSGTFAVADRIRGFVDDFIRPDERELLIQKGIFNSAEDIGDFEELMRKILPHDHRGRCYVLVKDKDGGHTHKKVCKATDRWRESSHHAEHIMNPVQVKHTQESILVMQEIGAAQPTEPDPMSGMVSFIPLAEWLDVRTHLPPSHGDEGIISPVIGALVAVNPNSDNCQMPSTYFIARYLAKYISKIDDYGKITIRPPKACGKANAPNTCQVTGDELLNTKISSNRIAQKDDIGLKRTAKEQQAMAMNVTDVYLKAMGYATIMTSLRSVKISTQTLEMRGGRERKGKPIDRISRYYSGTQNTALTALQTVPVHAVRVAYLLRARDDHHQWRHFKPTQVMKLVDDLRSPVSADSVTIFGFRPPELRFVVHQLKYYKWFKREALQMTFPKWFEYCVTHFDPASLEKTGWVCGGGALLKVRYAAFPELMRYLRSAPDHVFGDTADERSQCKLDTFALFHYIESALEWIIDGVLPTVDMTLELDREYRETVALFVCELDCPELPVPWFTPVKPDHSVRFLLHLLFSVGQFTDEYQLFSGGTLRDAFIRGRLLNENAPEESARRLMQKYFFCQLRGQSCGTAAFDHRCVVASNVIKKFFLDNAFWEAPVPASCYCRLRLETSDAITDYRDAKNKQFITSIVTRLSLAGFESVPSVHACLGATMENPIIWDIGSLPKNSGQPEESHLEQTKILRDGKNLVDSYVHGHRNTSTPGMCIVGGGGVGKTTLGLVITLYARTLGLQVTGTAMMSERAQELGCTHLNFDYAIPRYDADRLSTGQIGERIVSALLRNPARYQFIRTTDLEFLDELGNISAELLAAKDIADRYIKDSSSPNGGMMQIATQDHLQLHPVRGTHPLMSPFLTSIYVFRRLCHSVRAAGHMAWLRIQAITRLHKAQLSLPGQEEEFISLFVKHCSFVKSFSEVPAGALCVFGKNKPARLLEIEHCKRLRESGVGVASISKDYQRNYEGRFMEASPEVSKKMDTKMREQQVLYLYAGGRYRLAHNKPGVSSNGQLAYLPEAPSEDDVLNKRPLRFLVAPPGCRIIPVHGVDTEESLLAQGWQSRRIGIGPEKHVGIGFLSTKRTNQYAMQLFVGSTWHSTMGQTLQAIATKVERGGVDGGPYTLWDPCQVVVMMSRTRLPRETYFVTDDPEDTAKILYAALKKSSVYRDYLAQILESLCSGAPGSVPVVLDHSSSVYRPRDVQLPTDNTGFAYIMLSMRDLSTTYIGSTNNLIRRFTEEHNSGIGAAQTAPSSLRPWAILAFVTGFNGDRAAYVRFENAWIQAKNRVIMMSPGTASVEGFVDLARDIISDFELHNHGVSSLKLVDCGSIQRVRDVHGPQNRNDPAEQESSNESSNVSPVDVLQAQGDDPFGPYVDDEHICAAQRERVMEGEADWDDMDVDDSDNDTAGGEETGVTGETEPVLDSDDCTDNESDSAADDCSL